MFTHYMYNTLATNPAFAGNNGALSVSAMHRTQWLGFDGAPETQSIGIHSPIYSDNTGLGLSFVRDKIGPTNVVSFALDFSYSIKAGQNGRLAFGLKAGAKKMTNDLTGLELTNPDDNAFTEDFDSMLPNFGFGLYYYSNKGYLGVSIPELLENDLYEKTVEGGTNLGSEKKIYYLTAGYLFDITTNLKFKPTTILRYTTVAPLQADITGSVIFYDRVWVGAMVRTGDAVGGLLGVNFSDRFAIGYSFDWSYVNETANYNSGSHEVMLRYNFIFKEEGKIRSSRYF